MSPPGKFHGNIVPIATPFTPDHHLDVPAAERILTRCAEHEVGVFVLGTTGEAASIHAPLRTQLVELAVQVAGPGAGFRRHR